MWGITALWEEGEDGSFEAGGLELGSRGRGGAELCELLGVVLHVFIRVEVGIVRVLEDRVVVVAWVLVVERREEVGQHGHYHCGPATGVILACGFWSKRGCWKVIGWNELTGH